MFVDALKTFQKSEQKLAVVSNEIKSMMHDTGLELDLEKCATVHLINKLNDLILNLTPENTTQHSRIE